MSDNQELFCGDDDDNESSLENQLNVVKMINIGHVDNVMEVFHYLSLYKLQPDVALTCTICGIANYIERYDVFEVKLNKEADLISNFRVLGCFPEDIEYAELFAKIQGGKPRSIARFTSKDLNGQFIPFTRNASVHLPNSFLSNKPDYYLEVQFNESCKTLNSVKIEFEYIFLSAPKRRIIEYTENHIDMGVRRISVLDKKMIIE